MLTFKEVLEDFATTLDALRDFITSIGPVVHTKHQETLEGVARALAPFVIATQLASGDFDLLELPEDMKDQFVQIRATLTRETLNMPPEKVAQFAENLRKLVPVRVVGGKIELDVSHLDAKRILTHHRAAKMAKQEVRLLHESLLMALISRSEWFIAQLVHLFFRKYSDAAGLADPFFSFEMLVSLNTIEDAREALIEHRVEALMRQSLEDWTRFFKEKLKLGMSYLESDTSRISEVFKRRNLIVHNGGKVSRRYLSEVEEHLRPGVNLGDAIEVSPTYLNASIDLIEEKFVLLGAEAWRKLGSAEAEDGRATLLISLALERLKEQRWTVAKAFSFFVMNDKNEPEASRLRSQINYWQSFKWSGEYESIRKEVEASDFSAKGLIFQVAHAAISDNYKKVFEMLPAILSSGELKNEDLQDWPLFQGVREQPEFAPFRLRPPGPPDEAGETQSGEKDDSPTVH